MLAALLSLLGAALQCGGWLDSQPEGAAQFLCGPQLFASPLKLCSLKWPFLGLQLLGSLYAWDCRVLCECSPPTGKCQMVFEVREEQVQLGNAYPGSRFCCGSAVGLSPQLCAVAHNQHCSPVLSSALISSPIGSICTLKWSEFSPSPLPMAALIFFFRTTWEKFKTPQVDFIYSAPWPEGRLLVLWCELQ